MKCASVVVLLGAWFIMIPPETVNWHCARVQHDEAPMEQWKPFFHFETQQACESLRSEIVRRGSNPRRREATRAYRAEMDRKYQQNTPLHVRVFDHLFCGKCVFLWICGKDVWQPLDFFVHTRCVYREQGTP